eukprot:CAMPEP_0201508596 /NCGR_PEP_ID=MMETSP0161_2-20130828/1914_1 /ASSEMBLY_ACC=CAM_ASM_000251 /TAXON_ID=180227 /ORGANISM="Neoparamoeba aestuarina, Strain SoJaBio B1-5/56/2" /LENGTH=854 /DNA_ID=CAMNT_0047903315 /DNA_START=46 /DNA_END=2610 /DNA_ORIENTATION=-
MAVVGVDFGNLGSRIAVAQNRGIDTITNEVNNRTTPTLVQFNDQSRSIGESALSQYTRNVRNTIGQLKVLLGRKFADPVVQHEMKWVPFQMVEIENGNLGICVTFQGEERIMAPEIILGMLFGQLARTAQGFLKTGIGYSVVSCPPYYTDYQRRALVTAYRIGGFNPLRVVNEVSAAAYGFGMYQKDLPDSHDQKVAFVDLGESCLKCSIVSFTKAGMKVLSSTYDPTLGGREFDRTLATHFAVEIQKKYKIDVMSNKRALVRLLASCEKTKKILSANPQAPLHCPCIMEDIDVSLMINRSDFEEIAAPLFAKIKGPFEAAIEAAGVTVSDIAAVEQIGGAVRIPKVQALIKEVFGQDPGRRLNSEECIAKGCAMQCAVLSPKFQVKKDWKVRDVNPNGITIHYTQKNVDGTNGDVEVSEIFSFNNVVPSSKMMTFKNGEEIEITADYSDGAKLPEGLGSRIGTFKVEKVKFPQGGKILDAHVKVKVKLDDNSLFLVESATLEEEVEVEEEKKVAKKVEEKKDEKKEEKKEEEKKEEEKKDSEDAEMKDAEEKKDEAPKVDAAPSVEEVEKVLVKKTRRTPLKIVSDINAPMTEKQILDALEQEGKMVAHDQLIIDTAEARNTLESYVYDIRPKVRGELAEYYKEEEATKFVSELDAMEEWLYEEEGENASKSTYVAKYTELKKKGDFAINLQYEATHRAECIKSVEGNVAHFTNWAKSTDEKYAHISEEDRTKVLNKCAEIQAWLSLQVAAQESKKKFEMPALKINDLRNKQDELYKFANPVMSKAKPPPPKEEKKDVPKADEAPKAEEAKAEEAKAEEGPKAEDAPQAEEAPRAEDAPQTEKLPDDMEVDLD